MESKYIKITGITDVAEFVEKATLVDGTVLVKRGVYTVDGTSLLGMFSIDISQGATVEYPESAPATFKEFINKFVV